MSKDLHFTLDDSYSRLYDAIVRISNHSYAIKGMVDMDNECRGHLYALEKATREAWAILRDEVAVDPVRAHVREVVDANLTDEDRVSQLRGIVDEDRPHINLEEGKI